MKRYSALTTIIALSVCVSQVAQAQRGKEAKAAKGGSEANRLALEGAEALKSNDFDKAVDLLRKATNLDHKYTPDLAIAYERRGYALAKNQQFQDAVEDYSEAIKIKSNEPRIYEERAYAEMVSGNFFQVLGVRPALGRLFLPDDDAAPGANPVVVLSYGYWKRRLGANPEIVGHVKEVDRLGH